MCTAGVIALRRCFEVHIVIFIITMGINYSYVMCLTCSVMKIRSTELSTLKNGTGTQWKNVAYFQ